MNDTTVMELPIGTIAASKLNPRKRLDPEELKGLAASIAERGVLEPILVRQNGKEGHYEVICGERRLKASALAKKETIPAIVREMTDDEALETMITENLQRADVHYVDEAIGFKVLLDKGHSQEDIAAKVGKPLGYIASRLSLLNLIKPLRKPALEGQIPITVALRLSRLTGDIQNQYVQAKLPFEMTSIDNWLEQNIYLRLAPGKVPFDTASSDLLPKAGACTTCPKRTGANLILFSDFAKNQDVCTDPACYEAKCQALVNLRLEKNPDAVRIAEGYFEYKERQELDKKGVLRPFGYDNEEKGYRESKADACEHTVLGVVAAGNYQDVGKAKWICTALRCSVHTATGHVKAPKTPGKMDPERVKQQENLWQRRTGYACRVALHTALREQQTKLAEKARINETVPLEILRQAVEKAFHAIHVSSDARKYLESVWTPPKPGKKAKEHDIYDEPLVDEVVAKGDQSTLLRFLVDVCMADSIVNKFNTEQALNLDEEDGDVAKAYGLDVKSVLKTTVEKWEADKKAAYARRDERLKKELASSKKKALTEAKSEPVASEGSGAKKAARKGAKK